MTLTRFIVLANSYKHGDYCLAGIEPATGRWVRPVSELPDGRIPKSLMESKLQGYFPKLLDIVEMPLANSGPDFGFARENRSILPGDWWLVGQAEIKDAARFACDPLFVMHNRKKFVTVDEMQQKRPSDRMTLQLIRVNDFSATHEQVLDKHECRGDITTGGSRIQVPITDPDFIDQLSKGHRPAKNCLLTVSIGMPYPPPGWTDSPPCWKLIAAVIELT